MPLPIVTVSRNELLATLQQYCIADNSPALPFTYIWTEACARLEENRYALRNLNEALTEKYVERLIPKPSFLKNLYPRALIAAYLQDLIDDPTIPLTTTLVNRYVEIKKITDLTITDSTGNLNFTGGDLYEAAPEDEILTSDSQQPDEARTELLPANQQREAVDEIPSRGAEPENATPAVILAPITSTQASIRLNKIKELTEFTTLLGRRNFDIQKLRNENVTLFEAFQDKIIKERVTGALIDPSSLNPLIRKYKDELNVLATKLDAKTLLFRLVLDKEDSVEDEDKQKLLSQYSEADFNNAIQEIEAKLLEAEMIGYKDFYTKNIKFTGSITQDNFLEAKALLDYFQAAKDDPAIEAKKIQAIAVSKETKNKLYSIILTSINAEKLDTLFAATSVDSVEFQILLRTLNKFIYSSLKKDAQSQALAIENWLQYAEKLQNPIAKVAIMHFLQKYVTLTPAVTLSDDLINFFESKISSTERSELFSTHELELLNLDKDAFKEMRKHFGLVTLQKIEESPAKIIFADNESRAAKVHIGGDAPSDFVDKIESLTNFLFYKYNNSYSNKLAGLLSQYFFDSTMNITAQGETILSHCLESAAKTKNIAYILLKAVTTNKNNFHLFSFPLESLPFKILSKAIDAFTANELKNFVLECISSYLNQRLALDLTEQDFAKLLNEIGGFIDKILKLEKVTALAENDPRFKTQIQGFLRKYEEVCFIQKTKNDSLNLTFLFDQNAPVAQKYDYNFVNFNDVFALQESDLANIVTVEWLTENKNQLGTILQYLMQKYPKKMEALNKSAAWADLIKGLNDTHVELVQQLSKVGNLFNNKKTLKAVIDFAENHNNVQIVENLLRANPKITKVISEKSSRELKKSIVSINRAQAESVAQQLWKLENLLNSRFTPADYLEQKQRADRSSGSPWPLMNEMVQRLIHFVELSILSEKDVNVRNIRIAQWTKIAEFLKEHHSYTFLFAIQTALGGSAISRLINVKTEAKPMQALLSQSVNIFAKPLVATDQVEGLTVKGNVLPKSVVDKLSDIFVFFESKSNYKRYNGRVDAFIGSTDSATAEYDALSPSINELTTMVAFTYDGKTSDDAPEYFRNLNKLWQKISYTTFTEDVDAELLKELDAIDPRLHPCQNPEVDGAYFRQFFNKLKQDTSDSYAMDSLWSTFTDLVGFLPVGFNTLTPSNTQLEGTGDIAAIYASKISALSEEIFPSADKNNPAKIKEKLQASSVVDSIIVDLFKSPLSPGDVVLKTDNQTVERKKRMFSVYIEIMQQQKLITSGAKDFAVKDFYRFLSINPSAAQFYKFNTAQTSNPQEFSKFYLNNWLEYISLHEQFTLGNNAHAPNQLEKLDESVEAYFANIDMSVKNSIRWFFKLNPQLYTQLLSQIAESGTDRLELPTEIQAHLTSTELNYSPSQIAILSLLAFADPKFFASLTFIANQQKQAQALDSLQVKRQDNNVTFANSLLDNFKTLFGTEVTSIQTPANTLAVQHLISLVRSTLNSSADLGAAVVIASDWVAIIKHLLTLRDNTENTVSVDVLIQCITAALTRNEYSNLITLLQRTIPDFKLNEWMQNNSTERSIHAPQKTIGKPVEEEGALATKIFDLAPITEPNLLALFTQIHSTYTQAKKYELNATTPPFLAGINADSDKTVGHLVYQAQPNSFNDITQALKTPLGVVLHTAKSIFVTKQNENYTAIISDQDLLELQQNAGAFKFWFRSYKADGSLNLEFQRENEAKLQRFNNFEFRLPTDVAPEQLQQYVAKLINRALQNVDLTQADVAIPFAQEDVLLNAYRDRSASEIIENTTLPTEMTEVLDLPATPLPEDKIALATAAATARSQAGSDFIQFILEKFAAERSRLPADGEVTQAIIDLTGVPIGALSNLTVDASNISTVDEILLNIRKYYFQSHAIPFNYEKEGMTKQGYIFANKLELSTAMMIPRVLDYTEGALLIARNSHLSEEFLTLLVSNIVSLSGYYLSLIHSTQHHRDEHVVKEILEVFEERFLNSLKFLMYPYTEPQGDLATAEQQKAWDKAYASGDATFEDLRLAACYAAMKRGYNTIVGIDEETEATYVTMSEPLRLPERSLDEIHQSQAHQILLSNHGAWLKTAYDADYKIYSSTPYPTHTREEGAANIREEELWAKIPGNADLARPEELRLLLKATRTGFITPKDLRNLEVRRAEAKQNLTTLINLKHKNSEEDFLAAFGDWLENVSPTTPIMRPYYYGTLVSNNELIEMKYGKNLVKREFFHKKPKWDSESELVNDKNYAMQAVAQELAALTQTADSAYKPQLLGTNHPVNEGQYFPGLKIDLTDSNKLIQLLSNLIANLSHSKNLKTHLGLDPQQILKFNNSFGVVIQYLNGDASYNKTDIQVALNNLRNFLYLIAQANTPKNLKDNALMDMFLSIQAAVYLKYLNEKDEQISAQGLTPKDLSDEARYLAELNEEEVPLGQLDNNIPLLRAVYEHIIVHGMRGVLLGSCKSSADRFATVLLYSRSLREHAYAENGWLLAPDDTTNVQPATPTQNYQSNRARFYQRVEKNIALGIGQIVVEDNNSTRAMKKSEIVLVTSESAPRYGALLPLVKVSAKLAKKIKGVFGFKQKTPEASIEKELSNARKGQGSNKYFLELQQKQTRLMLVPYGRYQELQEKGQLLINIFESNFQTEMPTYHTWMKNNSDYTQAQMQLEALKVVLALSGMNMTELKYAEKLVKDLGNNLITYYQNRFAEISERFTPANADFIANRRDSTVHTQEPRYLIACEEAIHELDEMLHPGTAVSLSAIGNMQLALNKASENLHLANLQKRYADLKTKLLALSEAVGNLNDPDSLKANILAVSATFDQFNSNPKDHTPLNEAEKHIEHIRVALEDTSKLTQVMDPDADKEDFYLACDKVYKSKTQIADRVRAMAVSEMLLTDDGKKMIEVPKELNMPAGTKKSGKKAKTESTQRSEAFITGYTVETMGQFDKLLQETAQEQGTSTHAVLASLKNTEQLPTDARQKPQLRQQLENIKKSVQAIKKDAHVEILAKSTLRANIEEYNRHPNAQVMLVGVTESMYELISYVSAYDVRHIALSGHTITLPRLDNLEIKAAHSVCEVFIQLAEHFLSNPHEQVKQLEAINNVLNIALKQLVKGIKEHNGHFHSERAILQNQLNVLLNQWYSLYMTTLKVVESAQHASMFTPLLELFVTKNGKFTLTDENQRLLGKLPVFNVAKPPAVIPSTCATDAGTAIIDAFQKHITPHA